MADFDIDDPAALGKALLFVPPEFDVGEAAEGLTAAANHTGAMLALVPSEADLDRLALEGGEPREELHLTLVFLGEAAEIDEDTIASLRAETELVAGQLWPVPGEAFAAAMFNPTGEHPCWVLSCGGEQLSEAHLAALTITSSSSDGEWSPPEQHHPWAPHITLAYTDDEALVEQVAARVGPITFDRLRLAVGDEVTDYPLGEDTIVGNEGEGDMQASDTVTKPELTFHTARIRGATLVDIPAFIEARIGIDGPPDENGMQPWSGVLTVEDIPTGDGRVYLADCFRWEDPGDGWPFRWDIEDDGMHMGAVTVGTIREMTREGNLIRGRGVFDTNIPNGAAAAGLVERGTVTGVSIDMDDIPEDSVEVEYVLDASAAGSDDLPLAPEDTEWDPIAANERLIEFAQRLGSDEDDTADERFRESMEDTHFWRIDDADPNVPGSYLLPFADIIDGVPHAVPAGVDWAIAEADRMWDDGEITADNFAAIMETASDYLERLVESDEAETPIEIVDDELEASAWTEFQQMPPLPAAMFEEPDLSDAGEHVHYENGRIYGWVAQNGVCHDAFSGKCVTPPKKGTDLSTFNRQPIQLDDGSTLSVGVFTMDAGHDNDGANVATTQAQFDNTRTVAGLVRVGINDRGTWFSGVAAPWLSEWDTRVLTACRPSGHWKRLRNGNWSLRAVLSVPVPGFPTRTLAASAAVLRSNMMLAASAAQQMPNIKAEHIGELTISIATTDEPSVSGDTGILRSLASLIADEMESRQAIRAEVETMAASLGGIRSDLVASIRNEIIDDEESHDGEHTAAR